MNKVLLFNKYGISSGRLYSFEELYIWNDYLVRLVCPWLSQGFSNSTETILCVECSMSSDDAAEGFTMKTHWKGKGLLMKVKTRKGKVLVDVPWKFMSNCQ